MAEFVKSFGKYLVVLVLGALALLGGGTYTDTLKIITSDEAAATYCKTVIASQPAVADALKDAVGADVLKAVTSP